MAIALEPGISFFGLLFRNADPAGDPEKKSSFVCKVSRGLAQSGSASFQTISSNPIAGPIAAAALVAAAIGEAGVLASCGDSRQDLRGEASGEGSGGDPISPPVNYPDDNINQNPSQGDSQPPIGHGYDQSDIVPPGQSTYCQDNRTLVVANAETGETIYTSQCPPNMSCMYDICVQDTGSDFPPGSRDWFGDNVPSLCHWPRRIGDGEESEEFWNQFDPQNIKQNFTRCILSGYSGSITGWSFARAEDVPEFLSDYAENATPYSNSVQNACDGEDEGIFLTSHDPWALAEMTFTDLPVYRDEDPFRHADFYVVDVLPFFNGQTPSSSFRTYSRSNGIGSGSYGGLPPDLAECDYSLISSIFDATGATDETLHVYLQPRDNDGLGLADARIWTCICPMAKDGSQ